MTDRSILQRNKAVLWARDLISRGADCALASITTSTGRETIQVETLTGDEIGSWVSPDEATVESIAASLRGKEVVVGCGSPILLSKLAKHQVVVHDLGEYYKLYTNDANAKLTCAQGEAGSWMRELLHKLAGTSLVLDQADTGAGKWTSSHFKPSPSMLEKIKSFMKS